GSGRGRPRSTGAAGRPHSPAATTPGATPTAGDCGSVGGRFRGTGIPSVPREPTPPRRTVRAGPRAASTAAGAWAEAEDASNERVWRPHISLTGRAGAPYFRQPPRRVLFALPRRTSRRRENPRCEGSGGRRSRRDPHPDTSDFQALRLRRADR